MSAPASPVSAPAAGNDAMTQVLIVDDDNNIIATLHALLGRDCRLRAAHSGSDALRLARQQRPDLVLLDIEMLGMDGLELCRQWKADPLLAEVPVIFLTRRDGAEIEVEGLAAGAVEFIVKPPRGPVVLARIRAHARLMQLAEALRSAALIDSLTCVGNRRLWDQTLAREWLRARREAAPLSVLMVDVDHFKAYNDQYGHVLGDACLRAVAQALQPCFARPADLLARCGGEEFAVLLPGTERIGALALAAKVQQAVAAAGLAHAASPVGPLVSVSVGVGSYDEGCDCWVHQPDATQPLAAAGLSALMRAADAALYRAKQLGGACAEFIAAGEVCAIEAVISAHRLAATDLTLSGHD